VFELDHVPIGHHDLDRLSDLFVSLGFNVSAPCAYEDRSVPGQVWRTRAIFLEHGWLDLQADARWPSTFGAAPHSCLFRATTWEVAETGLPGFRTGAPEHLVGRWQDDTDEAVELVWTAIKERIAPLVLALVAYKEPRSHRCGVDHPNSAERLIGLTFGDADAGPSYAAASQHLQLSGFQYIPAKQFDDRFGTPPSGRVAMRFAASSVGQARDCMEAQGFRCAVADGTLSVPAQGELGCGIEFRGPW
jgi:hypothetical protein